LIHSKTNCDGFKEEGISFPSQKIQKRLLKEFYDEIGLPPYSPELGYVEAHCTSTKVGDPEECRALDEVFCTGRDKPLLIGSVKSNMGHAEPASGACSVAKVLIAFENRKIPPNIHFSTIKKEITALVEGRLKVVDEVKDLEGPLICVNSFGFGGANAHALFKGNEKVKVNRGIPKDSMPRLVVWSGRTEEAINTILDSVTKQPLDAEYVGLLQNSQLDSVTSNIYRGFGVFIQKNDTDNATCVMRDSVHFSGARRPIVWVYSGMGSQWNGMGKDLMNIPIFAESIERSHKILQKKQLNLKEIITSSDATMFDNILHSFVGIAAIQIGLTDVLKALGLEPDHIIGHSVGELGCAYADGCFTAGEMVLSAYARGKTSIESAVLRGSMAAVGLSYKSTKPLLKQGIEIACHNSTESCTISGPAEKVSDFVAELKSKGIFAKEVACSNVPFHSSYIAEMGPKLMSKLQEVIKTPKKRSPRWISSSVPKSRWDDEKSHYSSPHYHTNNLLSPVLFEEASELLPKDAITIEIAPHGLLQAILKRSLPDAVNISLTHRGHKNNDEFLIAAVGKIYANGIDLNVPAIYPAVNFPVSRGTPMISPNIKWDHSEDHFVMKFDKDDSAKSAERKVQISLSDPEYEFILGHLIDGRCLFPATGYLFLAWETLAMMKGYLYFDISVEFEDVKFVRATSITKDTDVEFTIVVHPGTGKFEISEKMTTLVTGFVREVENPKLRDVVVPKSKNSCVLPNRDFYKELRLRGYHYNGMFRSVTEARGDGLQGKIKWDGNWVAFLDCCLQLQIIGKDTRSLMLPTSIQKIVINTLKHLCMVKDFGDDTDPIFDVFLSPGLKNIRGGGVEIVNLKANIVGRRRPQGDPVLESYKFIPYIRRIPVGLKDALRVIVQLALENVPTAKVKGVEVDASTPKESILPIIKEVLEDLPLVTSDLKFLTSQPSANNEIQVENSKLSTETDCLMIVMSNCLESFSLLEKSAASFADRGFLICRERKDLKLEGVTIPEGFSFTTSIATENELLMVLQINKKPILKIDSAVVISQADSSYDWMEKVKSLMKKGPVVLVAENEPTSGIIGLVNCIRKEPEGSLVSCVFIDDKKAPKFSLDNPLYQNQLKLGLAINVLRDGKWGCYRHLQIQQNYTERSAQDHCYVNALVKSDLSSLKWISGPYNYSRPKGELVKVQYAALNFRDVMLATGKISAEIFVDNRMENECVLGMEYAGVTADGRRVMGMTTAAAMVDSS
jgi:fatty acid synthase, animal type